MPADNREYDHGERESISDFKVECPVCKTINEFEQIKVARMSRRA